MTAAILLAIKYTIGLRVSDEDEEAGLDVAVEAVEYTWDGLLEAIVAAES